MGPKEVVEGTVVNGRIVLDGRSPPEGTQVTAFVPREDRAIRLAPHLQSELESALEEADREEGIFAEELFVELRRHG